MSKTPSRNPPLSLEHGAELAARYGAGELLAALTAAYGVWTATAKGAIRRAGLTVRPEDEKANVCRVCGEPVRSSSRRFLCAAHVRRFCSRCEASLPEGRANRWCTACEAEHKQRLWQKPDRRCTTCGAPVTGRACQCAACLKTQYEWERQATRRTVKACQECGGVMPPGRRSVRCAECYRQRERARRQLRQQEGRHRCVMCGDPLPLSRASYCSGCDTMIANWRQAYHAGNKTARRLGTVERRRQWQQAQEG